MMFEERSVATLRKILDGFGIISGLRCNYDKTIIVPIGHVSDKPENLSGFVVDNKVKLLGMVWKLVTHWTM
jgi:hypothetical protein